MLKVTLPTPHYFPDSYEADQASLDRMFRRVCSYMQLDPDIAEVNLFADEHRELNKLLPYCHGRHQDAAGIYMKSEVACCGSKGITIEIPSSNSWPLSRTNCVM